MKTKRIKLKIFSEPSNYHEPNRYHLNTIAKSLWNERSNEERRQVYGKWVELFEYSADIARADVCLLTYIWSHYIESNTVPEALAEIENARAHNKPIVIFNGGDSPANLPLNDAVLFESAGYRSTPGLRYHSAQPTFISDYVQQYCGGELQLRHKTPKPVIGFCGQTSLSPIQTAWRSVRLKWRQHQYHQGKAKWEPAPYETSSFRSRVLKAFEVKNCIQTNYLLRSQYHGGDTNDKNLQSRLKTEFVDNILDSDYTVCMRGGGNYSVRFYETLCLGRIPIFIDTDCLLPFQDEIDYKSIFPWIDVKDLSDAAEIVQDFHARLSNDDFIDLQKVCRKLWLDHMTPNGFYRDFVEKITSLLSFLPSQISSPQAQVGLC